MSSIHIPLASKVLLVNPHSAMFRPRKRYLLDIDLSHPSPDDVYGQGEGIRVGIRVDKRGCQKVDTRVCLAL